MRKQVVVLCFVLGVLFAGAQSSPYSIIPAPQAVTMTNGIFTLNTETRFIATEACFPEAEMFVAWLNNATKKKFVLEKEGDVPTSNFVMFTTGRKFDANHPPNAPKLPGSMSQQNFYLEPGAYKLGVDARGILVTATYNTGILYAVQTLKQMFPVSAESGTMMLPYQFTGVRIIDQPKFGHRGFMLDCSRHFMSVHVIKKYLDLLAYYKMNVFHWHLTDDQGWRIQIDKYPLLTEVGAWRTEEDGKKYGGFYTKDEIREIVAYAQARHIIVIPEIEMPGHCTAAIAAYPDLGCTHEKIPVETEWGVFKDIYCAGDENTFVFLENVLNEVCELFPSPYIHIGGDEVPKFRWEHCEKCQARISENRLKDETELQSYFIGRVADMLAKHNRRLIGWDEILDGKIPDNALVQSWRGLEGGEKASIAGRDVIMSPTSHCYFDYGLASTDLAEVYQFDPIPAGLDQLTISHIRGGECNMWTEHVLESDLDRMVFPRLLAFAEVMWTYSEQRDFPSFYKRVLSNMDRLDAWHIEYGFPFVPAAMKTSVRQAGVITVELEKADPAVQMSYRVESRGENILPEGKNFNPVKNELEIGQPVTLLFHATWRNKNYPVPMIYRFDPHLALNSPLKLSYEPSSYYTGGGPQALTDGRIGTGNFRDGVWQAVQGKNLEAIVDLGEEKEITSLRSNWYHYGNAWIFRPSHVEYFTSTNGVDWKKQGDILATVPEDSKEETIVPADIKFPKEKARYVKMIAYNNGPCPSWHDAPGEPSWLFCDEIIVR